MATSNINERVNASVKKVPAEINEVEDFFRLRDEFSKLPHIPKILPATEDAPSVDFPGQHANVLVSGEESAGRFVMFEVVLEPGFGAPPHHQPNEDEWWFVLEGTLDIMIGNRKATVTAGGSAFAPRGCVHSFMNVGDGPARMLTMNSPAGHERFFEAISKLPEEEGPEARLGLLAAHDTVFYEDVELGNPVSGSEETSAA